MQASGQTMPECNLVLSFSRSFLARSVAIFRLVSWSLKLHGTASVRVATCARWGGGSGMPLAEAFLDQRWRARREIRGGGGTTQEQGSENIRRVRSTGGLGADSEVSCQLQVLQNRKKIRTEKMF